MTDEEKLAKRREWARVYREKNRLRLREYNREYRREYRRQGRDKWLNEQKASKK